MEVEYSYCVLKYRHDASAGEVLNIGVAIYSPENGQIGLMYDPYRFARLSEAFSGFDGDLYKQVLGRLRTALESQAEPLRDNLFALSERQNFETVADLLRAVWPDQGLAYYAGPPLYGSCPEPSSSDDSPLERELIELFDRFVLSQYDKGDRPLRYDDESVWNGFRRHLTPRGVSAIKSKTLNDVEFPYAYKNEFWHVLEPISFDYANPSEIMRKALTTVGKAYTIRNEEELGTMYILVGKPRREGMDKRYRDALRHLADMAVPHKIIEEDRTEAFASELDVEMRAHAVFDDESRLPTKSGSS